MKRTIPICVFFIIQLSIFSQINKYGTPFITNYTVKDYHANSQNWAVAQDERGVMYFGNVDGVLEYDGINWNLIETRNNAIVLSLAIDNNGRIYVGAEQEFGYIEPNEKGTMTYYSISENLLKDNDEFFKIWKTYIINGEVYFCHFKFIFKYNPLDNTLKTIRTGKYGFFSYTINNKLYHSDYNRGLMYLNKDTFSLCKGGDFYIKNDIWIILPYQDNKLLIGTESGKLFTLDKNNGNSEEISADYYYDTREFLSENAIYSSIKTEVDEYLIGTLWGGIIKLNEKGEIQEKYNKSNGLQDEQVFGLFRNKNNQQQNVWTALNNGLSRIEIKSPLRNYAKYYGIEGVVSDIIYFDNYLYIATDNGIFFLSNINQKIFFKKVEHTFGQCKDFLIHDKKLLVASNDIFEINKNTAKVYNFKNVTLKFYSKSQEKILYAAQVEGLVEMKYVNNKISDIKRINAISVKVEDIEENIDGNLWFRTETKGLYRMTEDKKVTLYDSSADLPADYVNIRFLKYKDDLYFATSKGIMEFKNEKFAITDEFNPTMQKIASHSENIFNINNSKWYFNYKDQNKTYLVKVESKDGDFSIDSVTYRRLPQMNYYAVYEDEDNITWIGTSEGLFSYNNNIDFKPDSTFNCLIRKVYMNGDSMIFAGNFMNEDSTIILKNQLEHAIPTLDYQFNSLVFHYASPYFTEEKETQYSFMLEGFDESWSPWEKKTYKEYTSLPEGHYTFKVKAKNVYGIESETANYIFEILPPWYRTTWAFIGYGILFILFVWLVVRLNTYRLQREKVRLERIVKQRTKEIRQQRDQLKELNEEIAKKNENITSSIRYAQRIQETIMPSEEKIKEILPDSFVLFKPKDIVSGDFYFCEKIDEKIVFSAVDCTGHGVPGAFVSMVGSNWLHRALKEEQLTDPAEIINYLSNGVYTSLRKNNDSDVKDGMDLALVTLDIKNMKAAFAGAHNPMFLCRDNDVIQFKADVFAVGNPFTEKFPSFNSHEFNLQKGDTIYVFSDGYIDQFGGPNRKKFMKKRFRELLLSIQSKSMADQKNILDKRIEEWKTTGNIYQIDDILVFGVKI